MKKLFILDDEKVLLKYLNLCLCDEFEVISFEDPEKALDAVNIEKPQILLIDYKLPKMNGVEFLEAIKDKSFSDKIIMMTEFWEELPTSLPESIICLNKPFEIEELLEVLRE